MMQQDKYAAQFISPEKQRVIGRHELNGPNGWLVFVACNAGLDFATSVASEYDKMLFENGSDIEHVPVQGSKERPITTVFPDTECCPRLPSSVSGSNAFIFQCAHETVTGNSVNENIQQLVQMVRTVRSHKARKITVVTPYCPYSRQDKPSFMQREATLASLLADQLKVAGADAMLTYHPHAYSLHGFYEPRMIFVAMSGLDLFVEIFQEKVGSSDTVVVSTDAGGAKFAVHFANAMEIPYAIANKFRTSGDKANLLGIIGDLKGKKTAIIVDDETATGTSLIYAAQQLNKDYGISDIHLAVSHMKLNKDYIPRFVEANASYGVKSVHFTDTIPQIPEILNLPFVHVHSIARRFAAAINRMHYNQSVSALFRQ